MILLTATNHIIRVVTESAADIDTFVSAIERNGSTDTPVNQGATITTATTTTILSAPSSGATRNGRHVCIHNKDASDSCVVRVEFYDGTNARVLHRANLGPGFTLTYVTSSGWAVDSGAPVPVGSDGQIQYNDAGAFGAASKLVVNANGSLEMLADSAPASPASGSVGLFCRSIANRHMAAQIGPSGLDTSLQPLLARNKIGYWCPPGNATTVPGVLGFTAPTVVGTATARTVATTNGPSRMRRLGYVSAAGAGSLTEARVAAAQFTCGSGSNDGSGFFWVTRFIPSNAATVAGERFFTGFTSVTTAATNVEPSVLTNCIGLAQLSSDNTQFYIVYGGSAAQTPIACGTSLGAPNTLTAAAFELAIFAPASVANTYYVQVTNIFTGATFSTTITGGSAACPQSSTLLAYKTFKTNNTTALAVAFDLCSMYVETDV